MSSVQRLQELMSDRLIAAAAEIFAEFEQTILRYEEEMDRQRRLLDLCWKPELKLHRVDPVDQEKPDPPVPNRDHKALELKIIEIRGGWTEPELSHIEDQREPELLQIKKEWEDPEPAQFEELCINQEEVEPHLKQETDPVLVTASGEECETEPDEEQLISQSTAGPKDQDQDSEPHKKIDTFDKSESSRDVDINRVRRSARKCVICGRGYKRLRQLSAHYRCHRYRGQLVGNNPGKASNPEPVQFEYPDTEPAQFEYPEDSEPAQFEYPDTEPAQFEYPEDPEPAQFEELCINQEEVQPHQQQETDPVLVTASDEECETEPDEEQLISQSTAGPKDQDQDSEPHKKIDTFDKSESSRDVDINRVRRSARKCVICGRGYKRLRQLSAHYRCHRYRGQLVGNNPGKASNSEPAQFEYPDPEPAQFEYPDPEPAQFEYPDPEPAQFEYPEDPEPVQFEYPDPEPAQFEYPEDPEPAQFEELCINQEEVEPHQQQETDPVLVTASDEECETEPDEEQLISQSTAGPKDQDQDSEPHKKSNIFDKSEVSRDIDINRVRRSARKCVICGRGYKRLRQLSAHYRCHRYRGQLVGNNPGKASNPEPAKFEYPKDSEPVQFEYPDPEPAQVEYPEDPEPAQFEYPEVPEPAQFEELCTNQEEVQPHQQQETDPVLVTASDEECETEPDEEQLISQSTAGPKDQDQDSEPHKKIDTFDKSESSRDVDINRVRRSAKKCVICGRGYKRWRQLSSHYKCHRYRGQLVGNNPEKSLNDAPQCISGTSIAPGGIPEACKLQLCCTICGLTLPTPCKLACHLRSHTVKYSCQTCGKGFTTTKALRYHKHSHISEKKKAVVRPHKCPTCGKQYTDRCSLVIHMRVHSGKETYSSQTCGKMFAGTQLLRSHMRRHTNKKKKTEQKVDKRKHQCPTCGKRYTTRTGLVIHIRVHTGEKPYLCQICGKTFAYTQLLNYHMKSHTNGIQLPEKQKQKHLCPFCGKVFTNGSNLAIHKRSHTGEKPFSCGTCEKQFVSKGSLRLHMNTHTGVKPFSCSMCEKTFTSNGSLKTHMRIHTGEKPYSCQSCGNTFMYISQLNTHMKVHKK